MTTSHCDFLRGGIDVPALMLSNHICLVRKCAYPMRKKKCLRQVSEYRGRRQIPYEGRQWWKLTKKSVFLGDQWCKSTSPNPPLETVSRKVNKYTGWWQVPVRTFQQAWAREQFPEGGLGQENDIFGPWLTEKKCEKSDSLHICVQAGKILSTQQMCFSTIV